jgi:hypothetical protein
LGSHFLSSKLEPEIQLSFNNNTLAQNFLSISISGAEAKAKEGGGWVDSRTSGSDVRALQASAGQTGRIARAQRALGYWLADFWQRPIPIDADWSYRHS